MKCFVLVVFMLIVSISQAIAIPYSIDGEICLSEVGTQIESYDQLKGNLNVDPNPDLHFYSDRIYSATYTIDSFSLYWGTYSFQGTGEIYMTRADIYFNLDGDGDLQSLSLRADYDCSWIDFSLTEHMPRVSQSIDSVLFPSDQKTYNGYIVGEFSSTPVPEPATIVLIGFGMVGIITKKPIRFRLIGNRQRC